MIAMRPSHGRSDDGFSLIELIVVVVILGILGALIAMIFVNTWRTQQNVTDQTAATTRGQLVASEIERAMRNAVAFEIEGGVTLKVTTSLEGTLKCQGFSFDSGGLKMTISDAPNAAATAWPVWQDQVEQSGTSAFFEAKGTNGVTYAFNATTNDAAVTATSPVHFVGDAYMRNAAEGSMSPCW